MSKNTSLANANTEDVDFSKTEVVPVTDLPSAVKKSLAEVCPEATSVWRFTETEAVREARR